MENQSKVKNIYLVCFSRDVYETIRIMYKNLILIMKAEISGTAISATP